jgi:putative transposase
MSRPLRIQYAGALYHITSRGNARQKIYLSKKDYENFLINFVEVIKRYNWVCYAYCLMPNHYHLLIKTLDPNLSLGMRRLNGKYTQSFNFVHKRVGHLFQGRYKAILVEDDNYLFRLIRYIILNPIKAKLVKSLHLWTWSSHSEMIKSSGTSKYISKKGVLMFFDKNPIKAKQLYIEHIKAKIEDKKVWEDLKGGLVLGSYDFLKSIKNQLKKNKSTIEIPKRERFANRPHLDELSSKDDIKSKKQRNNLIHKANIDFGYSLTEIGKQLNIHYTSISKIVRKVEKAKTL